MNKEDIKILIEDELQNLMRTHHDPAVRLRANNLLTEIVKFDLLRQQPPKPKEISEATDPACCIGKTL